jgi:hypothetical protein
MVTTGSPKMHRPGHRTLGGDALIPSALVTAVQARPIRVGGDGGTPWKISGRFRS